MRYSRPACAYYWVPSRLQPVLDVILAAGLTWAAHSIGVAVWCCWSCPLRQSAVPPEATFALVLGANLGTAINPVLEGATGNDPGRPAAADR